MKRFLIGAFTLVLACSIAVGQASLLNEATNGLFLNVNDYVIKPNRMFNTVNTKQILIGGGYNTMGIQNGANSGATLGYYHPGDIRWSVATSLLLTSEEHKVQENFSDNNGSVVNYNNPAFEKYKGMARFTLGLPNLMNLSAGAVIKFDANTPNAEDIPNGGTDTMNLTMSIPIGIELSPSIYNYVNPIVYIQQTINRPIPVSSGDTVGSTASGPTTKNTKVSVAVYDKFTIQNLLPAPFGAETSFWIGIGNVELSQIEDMEKPAYTINTDTKVMELNFATQFGMSNLLIRPIGDIELRMKPMVYFDILTDSHKSFSFGTTVAAPAGIYAPLGKLPMVLFCGVTPSLQFYTTTYKSETATEASRAVTTNVLWNGKIGTSIILPKDMVLDVTFDVNNNEANGPMTLGLSAQMTITL